MEKNLHTKISLLFYIHTMNYPKKKKIKKIIPLIVATQIIKYIEIKYTHWKWENIDEGN